MNKKKQIKRIFACLMAALLVTGTAVTVLPQAADSTIKASAYYDDETGEEYEDGDIVYGEEEDPEFFYNPEEYHEVMDTKRYSYSNEFAYEDYSIRFLTIGHYNSNWAADNDYNVQYADYGYVITKYNGFDSNITIPAKITSEYVEGEEYPVSYICPDAFKDCTTVKSVRVLGNACIRENAFSNCPSITTINIASGITKIHPDAFQNCPSLKSINVNEDNEIYSSLDGVLYNKSQSDLLRYPEGKSGSFTMPDTVSGLYNNAFDNCNNITSINLSKNLGTGSEDEGWSTDYDPTDYNESSIYSDRLVIYLPVSSLKSCKNLTSASVENSSNYKSKDGVISTTDGIILFCPVAKSGAYTLPTYATAIDSDAFSGCTKLTSITVPSTLKTIDSYAFSGCTGLTSVSLPSTLTSIYKYAFSGCTSLKTISLPDSVNTISEGAFSGCTGLTEITIPKGLTCLGNSSYNTHPTYYDEDDPDSEYEIEEPEIEPEFDDPDYNPHTTGIFYGCTNLKTVKLPDNLEQITNYCFSDCTSLTSITLPNKMNYIGSYVFYNCDALKKIVIPKNVTSIGYGIFAESGLVNASISGSITAIPSSAFDNCVYLESVSMPNTVESIDSDAFNKCTAMKSITLSSALKTIDSNAFFGCKALRNITIPKKVKNINPYAFSDCSGLTNVKFACDETIMGEKAFNNCSSLKSVKLPSGTAGIGNEAFGYVNGNKISDFKIYSAKGTEPKRYADKCGFTFVETIDEFENNSTVNGEVLTVGNKIIVNASAEGGVGPYTYAYYYKRSVNTSWNTFGEKGFNSTTTASFTPTSAADFDVKVIAKDSDGMQAEKMFKVSMINEVPLANNTNVSKTNFNVGEKVTVTGAASGGDGKYTYEFYYKRSTASSWTKFGSNGTGTFQPGSAGTFTIRTYAKDGSGHTAMKDFTLTATDPQAALTNKTTVSKTNFNVGEKITVTGAASGGDGKYTYEFYYKRSTASSWTKFGSNGTGTFQPGSAGTFTIRTYAKDSAGKSSVKDFTLTATDELVNKTTVSKSNFTVGEKITVTGAGAGGSGSYKYEFYYRRSGVTTWTKFGSNNTGTFQPGSAGTFVIRTYVKDTAGKSALKDFTLTASAPQTTLTNNTTVSKTNFTVGEAITVKGAASGGSGKYTYEFYYKRSTVNTWTKFDKNGTGTFQPGSAGTFTIKTYVKDSNGKTAVKEFTLTATDLLTNKTTVSKTNFNVGETITVKGAASGGTGSYTYEFYYKRSTADTWTKFDKNGTGTFKPGSAGTFTIKTYVKDSSGKSSVKEFTLTAK